MKPTYPALCLLFLISSLSFSGTRLPSFPVQDWKNHPGGPLLEPYFLQDQLYDLTITLDKIPSSKDKVNAVLHIADSKGKQLTESRISIKLRGSTSMDSAKKQYGISTLNAEGKGIPVSLLEMPAAEDWVISAPYSDKSLLRDILTYNISNKLGRHAPRTRI